MGEILQCGQMMCILFFCQPLSHETSLLQQDVARQLGGSKAPNKQETSADLLGHDGPGLGKDAQHILTRWAPAPSAAINRVITPLIL